MGNLEEFMVQEIKTLHSRIMLSYRLTQDFSFGFMI